jgi:4-hydroxy-3-polyprenylbenzoate decarboxylase
MIDHTLGRVLDLFDIDVGKVRRWTGGKGTRRPRPVGRAAAWDAVPKPDLVD